MTIKITEKILSIPPYVSTSWKNIAALHLQGNTLAVTLNEGSTVHIPNLDQEMIHSIFQHHGQFLEKEEPGLFDDSASSKFKGMMDEGEPSVRFAFGTSLDGLGNMMQHNPSQADAPDLPPEILQKIGAIAKIVAPAEDGLALPTAVPHCNCFHCQIAKVLNPEELVHENEDPEVPAEELLFEQWMISQTGDRLFSVTNKLDAHEQYNVYLGEPVGCTCGKTGCEHILAVLKS